MNAKHTVYEIGRLCGEDRPFDERTDRLRKSELLAVADTFDADVPDDPTRRDIVEAINDARGVSGHQTTAGRDGYTKLGLSKLHADLQERVESGNVAE